jgi:hypothetical protein
MPAASVDPGGRSSFASVQPNASTSVYNDVAEARLELRRLPTAARWYLEPPLLSGHAANASMRERIVVVAREESDELAAAACCSSRLHVLTC